MDKDPKVHLSVMIYQSHMKRLENIAKRNMLTVSDIVRQAIAFQINRDGRKS